MRLVRVLLVDDHAIVRRGLRDVIAETLGDASFDEAETAAAALALADAETWRLAIVDLSLPGRGGLDLVRDLRIRRPALRIVVLSMHDEREYVVRALRAGASAYVTKTAAPDELPEALRRVLAGDTYVTGAVAAHVIAELARDPDDPVATLSDRELQVLRMIGAGRSVKQIATELALSEKTVSTYRTRLLTKLKLTGTAELIRFAVDHGLV